MRKYFVIVLFVFVSCSTAKIPVIKVEPGTVIDKTGVFYALPKNEIVVGFEVAKETLTNGKYWECADLLHTRLKKSKNTVYDIKAKNALIKKAGGSLTFIKIKDFSLSKKVKPDLEEIYMIELEDEPGAPTRQEFTITLDEAGLVTSLNATAVDKTFEMVVTVLGIVADGVKVATGVAPLTPTVDSTLRAVVQEAINATCIKGPKPYKNPYKNADAAITKIETLETEIDGLESDKSNLKYSKATIEMIIKNKRAKIKKLMESNFTGKTTVQKWKPSFSLIPEEKFLTGPKNSYQTPLFSLKGKNCIFVDPKFKKDVKIPDDLNSIECENARNSLAQKETVLEISMDSTKEENLYLVTVTKSYVEPEERGITYRMPGMATIEVIHKINKINMPTDKYAYAKCRVYYRLKPGFNKPKKISDVDIIKKCVDDKFAFAESDTQIAQFGEEFSLPASLGGSKTTTNVTFFPDTGGLKTLHTIKEPFSADTLKSAGEAVTSTATSLRDLELNKLRRKKEKLELDKEIDKLEEEANGSQTTTTP